jgi:hypothetical protein
VGHAGEAKGLWNRCTNKLPSLCGAWEVSLSEVGIDTERSQELNIQAVYHVLITWWKLIFRFGQWHAAVWSTNLDKKLLLGSEIMNPFLFTTNEEKIHDGIQSSFVWKLAYLRSVLRIVWFRNTRLVWVPLHTYPYNMKWYRYHWGYIIRN